MQHLLDTIKSDLQEAKKIGSYLFEIIEGMPRGIFAPYFPISVTRNSDKNRIRLYKTYEQAEASTRYRFDQVGQLYGSIVGISPLPCLLLRENAEGKRGAILLSYVGVMAITFALDLVKTWAQKLRSNKKKKLLEAIASNPMRQPEVTVFGEDVRELSEFGAYVGDLYFQRREPPEIRVDVEKMHDGIQAMFREHDKRKRDSNPEE